MSRRNLLAAAVLAAIVLAALCSPSLAQFKKPEPQPYDGKGTIGELGFDYITFNDAEGKTMAVGFNQKTKVTVTGTAEPGFLAPGLIVRFSAVITGKGLVEEAIKELAVIEVSELNKPGMQADLAPGEDLKEAEKKGPVTYVVIGTIRSIKNKQLQILAGKTIRAEVADDCKITIDVSNPGIAREGDEISVTGKLLQEPQKMGDSSLPGQVLGEKVEIALSKPLTAPGKKKGAKPKTPRKKKGAASEAQLFGN